MSDELDLDPDEDALERAQRISAAGRAQHKAARAASGNGKATRKPSSVAQQKKDESDLAERISDSLAGIAEQFDARGDDEMARALREDSPKITAGLVALARSVTFIRTPLLLVFGMLGFVLAFWRITRMLLGRMIDMRAARREARQNEGRHNIVSE